MKRRYQPRHEGCWRSFVRKEITRILELAFTLTRDGRIEESRLAVKQALEISKSTRVRMPRRLKRMLCKRCKAPLLPGLTATVRLRSAGGMSYLVVRCRLCEWIHRRPYKRRGTQRP